MSLCSLNKLQLLWQLFSSNILRPNFDLIQFLVSIFTFISLFLKSICKNAGADKDDFDKVVGTHWSMKVWKDGQSWGSHISCKELPDMDCLETFTEGEEKSVDHALFGGKGKVES